MANITTLSSTLHRSSKSQSIWSSGPATGQHVTTEILSFVHQEQAVSRNIFSAGKNHRPPEWANDNFSTISQRQRSLLHPIERQSRRTRPGIPSQRPNHNLRIVGWMSIPLQSLLKRSQWRSETLLIRIRSWKHQTIAFDLTTLNKSFPHRVSLDWTFTFE